MAAPEPAAEARARVEDARRSVAAATAAVRAAFEAAEAAWTRDSSQVEMISQAQLLTALTHFIPGGTLRLRSFDTPPHRAEVSRARLPGMLAQLAAGTEMTVVYSRASLSPQRMREEIEPLTAAGLQPKTVPSLPVKMLLSDAVACLLPTDPVQLADFQQPTVLCVRPGALHTLLADLFEATWHAATPLPTPAAPEDDQPLLRLLADGVPDEVAAARLGISTRTYFRRLRALMATTGTTTRFQLGLHAARHGRVPAPGG